MAADAATTTAAKTQKAPAGILVPDPAPQRVGEGADALYDLVVCGAGPAGMTAGIYGVRAGLKTVVLESRFPGGQLNLATGLENVPGFPEPIAGLDLAFKLEEQMKRLGAELLSKGAKSIAREEGSDPDRPVWRVAFSDGTFVRGRTVIVATGAFPRHLGLPGEGELAGAGVSYCSTCDGGFFKGRDVAVVGGGNTAVEDAIYLARLCRKVTLIHRRDELRAERVEQEVLFRLPNVTVVWDTVVTALRSDGALTGLDLLNKKTGATDYLPVAAVFVAIGQKPFSDPFAGLLETDENGYLLTDELLRTKQPGIFAAGDVRRTPLRQIVTAMSDGALAVAQAAHYLNLDGMPKA